MQLQVKKLQPVSACGGGFTARTVLKISCWLLNSETSIMNKTREMAKKDSGLVPGWVWVLLCAVALFCLWFTTRCDPDYGLIDSEEEFKNLTLKYENHARQLVMFFDGDTKVVKCQCRFGHVGPNCLIGMSKDLWICLFLASFAFCIIFLSTWMNMKNEEMQRRKDTIPGECATKCPK